MTGRDPKASSPGPVPEAQKQARLKAARAEKQRSAGGSEAGRALGMAAVILPFLVGGVAALVFGGNSKDTGASTHDVSLSAPSTGRVADTGEGPAKDASAAHKCVMGLGPCQVPAKIDERFPSAPSPTSSRAHDGKSADYRCVMGFGPCRPPPSRPPVPDGMQPGPVGPKPSMPASANPDAEAPPLGSTGAVVAASATTAPPTSTAPVSSPTGADLAEPNRILGEPKQAQGESARTDTSTDPDEAPSLPAALFASGPAQPNNGQRKAEGTLAKAPDPTPARVQVPETPDETETLATLELPPPPPLDQELTGLAPQDREAAASAGSLSDAGPATGTSRSHPATDVAEPAADLAVGRQDSADNERDDNPAAPSEPPTPSPPVLMALALPDVPPLDPTLSAPRTEPPPVGEETERTDGAQVATSKPEPDPVSTGSITHAEIAAQALDDLVLPDRPPLDPELQAVPASGSGNSPVPLGSGMAQPGPNTDPVRSQPAGPIQREASLPGRYDAPEKENLSPPSAPPVMRKSKPQAVPATSRRSGRPRTAHSGWARTCSPVGAGLLVRCAVQPPRTGFLEKLFGTRLGRDTWGGRRSQSDERFMDPASRMGGAVSTAFSASAGDTGGAASRPSSPAGSGPTSSAGTGVSSGPASSAGAAGGAAGKGASPSSGGEGGNGRGNGGGGPGNGHGAGNGGEGNGKGK
jgi:hypothetical protein